VSLTSGASVMSFEDTTRDQCKYIQDDSFSFKCTVSDTRVLSFPVLSPGSAVAFNTLPTPSGKPFDHFPAKFTDVADVVGSSAAFAYPRKLKSPGSSAEAFILSSHDGGKAISGLILGHSGWLESGRSEADVAAELEECLPHVPTEWLKACAAACMPSSKRQLRCADKHHCYPRSEMLLIL
jgi:hypothetical protein